MKKNPVVPADIRDFLSADSINSFYFHYNIDIGFPCRHTFPIMFKLFFKLIIMGAAMSSLADDAGSDKFYPNVGKRRLSDYAENKFQYVRLSATRFGTRI